MEADSLSAAGVVVTVVLVIIFAVMVGTVFPLQAFGSPPKVFDPSFLGEKISLYLWSMRVWDLTVIALLFFFSALGCIAMFRMGRRG